MDGRRLRYFVEVAEVLHFGRAAGRLGIAQPALSQQIKALEQEVGLRLLHRSSREVSLTDAGRALLPHAHAVLEALGAAEAAAAALRAITTAALRLGVPANLPDDLLPRLLLAMADAAPDLQVRTISLATGEQLSALRAGTLDAGLVRQDPTGEGLAAVVVDAEPVGVALPAGHRLAKRDAVRAVDLQRLELVTAPPVMMPGFAAELMRALRSAGWRDGPVRESPDTEATLGLVAAGLGAAPMLRSSVSRHATGRDGRIVWRPFADVEVSSRLWCAWHPQRRTAAVEVLLAATGSLAD